MNPTIVPPAGGQVSIMNDPNACKNVPSSDHSTVRYDLELD
ncbi:hypothetical protein [Microbacterium deminutum]